MKFNLGSSAKSMMQLMSANIAVKFLGIALIAFFARFLSKEELALLPVYEMLAAFTGIIAGFGLQPTFLRILPAIIAENDMKTARSLVLSGATVLISGAALFSVGVFIFAEQLNHLLFHGQDYGHLIRIISVGFFFVAVRNFAHFLLWSGSRFDKISVIQIVTAVGRAVFLSGLLLLWRMEGLALGLVLNEVLSALLSLYFARDILRGPRVGIYPIGKLLKMSLPFYFEGFLIYFRSQGDNWIVATTLGPAAMSVYFVAKRLPMVLIMFIESFDKVVTAEISKRRTDHDEIKKYVGKLFILNSYITLPGTVVVMGFAPLFIFLVAGQAYMSALVPCVILCAVLPIQSLQIPLGRSIFVIHPPLTRVALTIAESLGLLGCLLLLIPRFAENGIATSRILSAGLGLILAILVLRKSIKLTLPWAQAIQSAVFSLAMLGTVWVLRSWHINPWLAPIHTAAALVVYLLLVSIFNHKRYYDILNSMIPIHITDPFRRGLKLLTGDSESEDVDENY